MKRSFFAVLALAILAIACANFSTTAFRTEQTLTDGVHTAFVGWTNYLLTATVDPAVSNTVKQARLKFAASVGVVESWRVAYQTNSALKPQLQAALTGLVDNGSNLIWLITYFREH